MPRLGREIIDENDDENQQMMRPLRPEAVAYPSGIHASSSRVVTAGGLRIAAVFLLLIWIVTNMLSRDYEQEARTFLQQTMNEEEIDRYVPRSPNQRKKDEYEAIRQRLDGIDQAMDRIHWKVFGTNDTTRIMEITTVDKTIHKNKQ